MTIAAGRRRSDCRFCGDADLTPVYRQPPWIVARCRSCGHYSTTPWPQPGDEGQEYGIEYYEARGIDASDASRLAEISAGHEYRVRCVERFARPPGVLLDIGGATGGVAEAAVRQGWDAHAFDTSEAAVERGRTRIGDRMHLGGIEAAAASRLRASVLTAYHVLEHTAEPRAFIRYARELLAPGGLLVLEVPDVSAFDTRFVPRVRRMALDLPRHLCHFTPDTLGALLREFGFEVVAVEGTLTVLLDPLRRLRVRSFRTATGTSPVSPPTPARDGVVFRLRRLLSGYAFCAYARRP